MTRFNEHNPEQLLLFPPDPGEWLADGRLAYSIRDVAGALDLCEICADYDSNGDGQCGIGIETRRKAQEVSVVDLGQIRRRRPRGRRSRHDGPGSLGNVS